MQDRIWTSAPQGPAVDTEQFARINHVKSQTVLKRLGQTGSYYGIRPIKLINRRLSWPSVQVTVESHAQKESSI